jgi:molybdate transport system substrate-binding protein
MWNLRLLIICLPFILLFPGNQAIAETIRVAVASNFSETMKQLASRFQKKSGHKVIVIKGSSGKHYAQILHGAPFDVFFSADTLRPAKLEEAGKTVKRSRFTYAVGKLVLWSPRKNLVDSQGLILQNNTFRHIAIANPKLAPYGKAAQQVLEKLGLLEQLQHKIVRGENISQTFQFVKSGNAELGFIAYSQLKISRSTAPGSWWNIPASFYSPINQQAVLLNSKKAALDFITYIKTDASREIIQSYGYNTP